MVMLVSVTPCSVAPLAVPAPHGDARSPKVGPFGAVVVVAALAADALVAAALAALVVAALGAAVVAAVVVAVVVAPPESVLRLPLHAAAIVATAMATAPHRRLALRIMTSPL